MSRDDQASAERTLHRLAHAFTPAEWTGRWLVIGIVVFASVAAITVVQRALVARGAVGWTITALHGALVLVLVPLLVVRTVREWRRNQPTGVPE